MLLRLYHRFIVVVIFTIFACRICPAISSEIYLDQCRLDTWSVRDGLPLRDINSIAQTPDGFLWLGTSTGLIRFDGNTFTVYDSQNSGLKHNSANGLMVDDTGKLWIGTVWDGFGTFEHGQYHQVIPSTIEWSGIITLYQAKDKSIWAGGIHNNSIFHYKDGKCETIGNIGDIVNGFIETDDGSIIMAKTNIGLYQLTPHSASKEMPYLADAIGYNIGIGCFLWGDHDDLWLGSAKHGVFCYDEYGKVHHYGTANGLSSLTVKCMYKDQQGIIWIGTDNGIDRWDGKRFVSFGNSDGLPSTAVSAIFQDHEGNLWVASGGRLCRFAEPKVIPLSISLNGKKIGVNMIASASRVVAPLQAHASASRVVTPLPAHASTSRVVAPLPVYAGKEQLWCATDDGICLLNQQTITWFTGTIHHRIFDVAEGPDHLVWMIQEDPNDASFKHVVCISRDELMRSIIPVNGKLPTNVHYKVMDLCVDNTFLIAETGRCISVNSDGISYISKSGKISVHKVSLGWPFDVKRDTNGAYWVCSTNGLYRIIGNSFTLCNKNLPAGVHITNVDVGAPNDIWAATDLGIAHWDGKAWTLIPGKMGVPETGYAEIVKDYYGDLWVGATNGFMRIDGQDLKRYLSGYRNNIRTQLYQESDGARGLPGGNRVIRSESGSLWFLTDNGVTLIKPRHIITNTIPPPVSILSAVVDNTTLGSRGVTIVPPGRGMLNVSYTAATYVASEKVRFRYRLVGMHPNWIDIGKTRSINYMNLAPGQYTLQIIACNNDGVWNLAGQTIRFRILPHYYQTIWFRILVAVFLVGAIIGMFMLRIRQIKLRNIELENKVLIRTAELAESNKHLNETKAELEQQFDDLQSTQSELEAQNEEIIAMHASLVEANAKLENLAAIDGLTGMKNHRIFQEELNREWNRLQRNPSPLSIIMLDIDHFKQLNDTFGHLAGDAVLIKIGSILNQNIRETDVAARYGGEEFVIIAPGTSEESAVMLADRLRTEIASTEWPKRQITASFGVATISITINQTPTDLVGDADRALYYSKTHGRNRVTHIKSVPVTNS